MGRNAAGRPPPRPARPGRPGCTSTTSSSRKRSTARDPHEIPALEAAGQRVGVAEHAGRDAAAAVAQLERQIRRAAPGRQAVLARAGEHPSDLVARPQGADRTRREPHPMMYGDPDAAAAMGVPSRRAPRPGAGVRVQGLERRSGRRLERRSRSSAARSAPSASRRSIPRSSTTSRPPGRRSRSSKARPGRSSGRRSRSTRHASPARPRDLILLAGAEPSFRWQTFSKLIVEVAEAIGVQLVVTLGALLADVPHSRPISVTGLASDPALVARLGLASSCYEGPTGIVGVLHAACQQAGLPSASLWAASRITLPPRRTRRRHWRSCASSRASSAWRSTRPSSSPRPPTTSARSISPCRAIPTCSRSSSGSSRPPSEEADDEPGPLPSGRDDRPGAPALPAPARATTSRTQRHRAASGPAASEGSALGGRARESVVAHRAGRERRRRLEALSQDAVGDLHDGA